ncbi:MAG: MarR family transcriptional regulator [Pedosphaera parvula]|nr:MarR family transcriptional regulator [Pedosphaera parvula]
MAATKRSTESGTLPLDAPGRRRLPILLRRAWYGLNQAFRRRIAPLDATPDQFTVLRNLVEGDAEGLTQCQLSDLMSSDPNTIASLLERMEKIGWIQRQRHERDRRAYRIRVKPAGLRKFQEVRVVAVGLQAEVLSVFTDEEREQFLAQLDLLATACRGAAGKSVGREKPPKG